MVNAQAVKLPARPVGPPTFLPVLVAVGAVAGAITYVQWQLKTNSRKMDGFFAQYNSPESEASRKKVFEGSNSDPRTSAFNVLGWR